MKTEGDIVRTKVRSAVGDSRKKVGIVSGCDRILEPIGFQFSMWKRIKAEQECVSRRDGILTELSRIPSAGSVAVFPHCHAACTFPRPFNAEAIIPFKKITAITQPQETTCEHI